MRAVLVFVLAVSLMASSAFATGAVAASAPLPAGKPAGAKEAALLGPSFLLVLVSAGVIAGGLALATTNGSGKKVTTATTTATGTLP